MRPITLERALPFPSGLRRLAFYGTPIGAWWSRRQELAADDFAVEYADADKLVSALVKLYRDNATTLTPDRVHSAFYDSHPAAVARITRLNRLARENARAALPLTAA